MLQIENQTFLVFVQFSENLRNKRFDTKDLKNYLFGDCLRRKQTFVTFVQFGESLYSKTFEVNDLKNTLLGLLKA